MGKLISYPLEVLKVRRVIDGQAGWVLDGAINYFAIKIARNWPFENIPWLLEFFSVLIRRPDLATLITDENTYLQMFTILANFTNGDAWGPLAVEDDLRADQHYCISLAHMNILKLFLRIDSKKREKYLKVWSK